MRRGPNRSTARKTTLRIALWAGLTAAMLCCLLALVYYQSFREGRGPSEYHLGSSRTLAVEFSEGGTCPNWFTHNFRQTDDFQSVREYELQLPNGVFRVGLTYDPIESVRAALPNTVPELTKLLSSRRAVEVYCAAEALAGRGSEALPALPTLLAIAERERMVFPAIRQIAEASDERAAGLLAAYLSMTNQFFQMELVAMIAGLGENGAKAIPGLCQEFYRATGFNQVTIAHALWRVGADCGTAVPALLNTLATATNTALQTCALQALSEIWTNPPPLPPTVFHLLEASNDPVLVTAGIRLLQPPYCEPAIAVPCLSSILERNILRNYPAARMQVMNALGEMKSLAIPVLTKYYQTTNSIDAASAARALAKVIRATDATAEIFLPDLYGTEPQRIRIACDALGALGPKAEPAIGRLRDLAQAGSWSVRVHAASALANLDLFEPRFVLPLLDCVRAPYPTRTRCIEILRSEADKHAEIKARLETCLTQDQELARRCQSVWASTRP